MLRKARLPERKYLPLARNAVESMRTAKGASMECLLGHQSVRRLCNLNGPRREPCAAIDSLARRANSRGDGYHGGHRAPRTRLHGEGAMEGALFERLGGIDAITAVVET